MMLAPRGNSNMWLRYLYLLTEQPSDFNSIAMRQVSFLARYVASCTSIGNYIRTLPAGVSHHLLLNHLQHSRSTS